MHMVSDNHAKRAAEEAEANKRRVKAITEALDGANFLRANLATLYQQCEDNSIAEVQIGNALVIVRRAASELKKAQVELMKQPLPGMD